MMRSGLFPAVPDDVRRGWTWLQKRRIARDRRVENAGAQRRAGHRPDRHRFPCCEPPARLPVDGRPQGRGGGAVEGRGRPPGKGPTQLRGDFSVVRRSCPHGPRLGRARPAHRMGPASLTCPSMPPAFRSSARWSGTSLRWASCRSSWPYFWGDAGVSCWPKHLIRPSGSDAHGRLEACWRGPGTGQPHAVYGSKGKPRATLYRKEAVGIRAG